MRGSAALKFLLAFLAAAAVLYLLLFSVLGTVVAPNEIGIRQSRFSFLGLLHEGYDPQGLLPGLHWQIPGVSTVHKLPRDFQFINLNSSPSEQSGDLIRPELEVPTTDGSKVKTDISLIVRYFEAPGETEEVSLQQDSGHEDSEGQTGSNAPLAQRRKRSHGGLDRLLNTYTADRERQLKLLLAQAEDYLKSSLSTLSTTDYYNPVLRESASLAANEDINSAVNQNGIELWGTLIRRYVYSEKNIDDQIFAKNLQEQTERLNAAKRKLEEAKAETKDALAEWDAKIMDVKVQAEQEKVVIVSEADRYEVELRAKGDRIVQESFAEVDRLKNTILSETPGADIYVARQMAPLLSTLEGGIITDVDPYNIDSWVKKLVGVSR